VPVVNEHSEPVDIETVVIGAGQAGLGTGHHLARLGRPFVILDCNRRIGDNWRSHWDSLRVYSPAKYDSLPGMPFPAPDWSYPTKDEVADYLAAYVERFRLPVRTGVRVDRVRRQGDRYLVTAGDRRYEADNVVVATGTFGRAPLVPAFASELDPGIRALHSSEYKNPAQLRDGAVLVVGASHSGGDVAYEVAAAGHRTILCGRPTGQLPFRIDSRVSRVVFPVLFFLWSRVVTIHNPLGRRLRSHTRFHGGPLLRVRAGDLAAAGVERAAARMVGVRDGRPVLADGRVLDVRNVVWCTGFRQDFGWIDLPVIGPDCWPEEECGIVAASPGLYFCGLSFQREFSSMLSGGAGRDAEIVAKHIAARSRAELVAV
jgi:putative flavoprotein involved in K+ transport